ncbi:hypothetical protein KM043_008809 [Ampulex compressa]|nr:hypothetical protein KM043_008809 [Ampulex compressa]
MTCKATTVIVRYESIVNLTKMLLAFPCSPEDEQEAAIQSKFDNFIRMYTIRYSMLAGVSATGVTIRSVFSVIDGNIPYRVWLPYDCTATFPFLCTVMHQMITVILGTIVNVATETLIFGLILQTCSQLEILELRFQKLAELTKATTRTGHLAKKTIKVLEKTFSSCITHHLCIYNQFLDLVLVVDNVNDFITNILMFMTMVGVTSKGTTAVLCYDDIFNLRKALLEEPCKERDAGEIRIQKKFDSFIRESTIRYSMLAGASVTGTTILSVFSILEGNLPYRAWLPYNYDTTFSFLITAIQQIVTIMFATIVNVGTETLIFGFILQTCAQLEILEHRFQKLTRLRKMEERANWSSKRQFWDGYVRNRLAVLDNEREEESHGGHETFDDTHQIYQQLLGNPHSGLLHELLVVDNVDDFITNMLMFMAMVSVTSKGTTAVFRYDDIFNLTKVLLKDPCKVRDAGESRIQKKFDNFIRFATTVNYIFNSVMFIQFFGSILVLCASVYYISIAPVAGVEFFGLVFYTLCMFVQIFIYCWSGNEVTIKSANFGTAMYETDWLSLTMNEKKSLMVIMKRSTIPIKFTSSFLVTLTLDSYTNILKTSYSAFNLLQGS